MVIRRLSHRANLFHCLHQNPEDIVAGFSDMYGFFLRHKRLIPRGQVSRYHLGMTTRRELRSTRIQLAKEEGVLRELKRGADIGGLGNASTAMARDIEHSEREVELLRAKLKRLKVRV